MASEEPKRVAFETARLELARLRVHDAGHGVALQGALRLCARTVKVERVGFWRFTDDLAQLQLELGYTLSTDDWNAGDTLTAHRFPTYWKALSARRVIAAHDAATDPDTSELATAYLAPLGISSLLDAPVFRAGELIGVICFEHVGPARTWTTEELTFASATGDLVAMLLEQSDRIAAEAAARVRTGKRLAADKLELLDSLCRGLAHDFANVLLAVDLVGTKLAHSATPELAVSLRSCVDVGTNLVTQLRRFGARGIDESPRLSVRAVIERLMPIVVTLVRDHANVTVDLDDLAPEAISQMSAAHLEQIVLNLCLNARDAVSDGGTIAVTGRLDGDAIVVTVADDGAGMSPELARQIWDRDFTTKPHGTGLGLATVKSLVEENAATIEVVTALDRGATFTLTLQRA